jgi:hypothetical protein
MTGYIYLDDFQTRWVASNNTNISYYDTMWNSPLFWGGDSLISYGDNLVVWQVNTLARSPLEDSACARFYSSARTT